jgi:hypothetical protein
MGVNVTRQDVILVKEECDRQVLNFCKICSMKIFSELIVIDRVRMTITIKLLLSYVYRLLTD